jgi:uncharacterized membrane protein YfcA
MQELIKISIGILFLAIGFPIGSYLARKTKEELKTGQKWFRLIIIASLCGAFISVFFKSDVLIFSFLFIAIVTSRSLKSFKKKIVKKK